MKKTARKMLSVLLVVIMLAGISMPVFAAGDTQDLPIVYLMGRGNYRLTYEDGATAYPLQYNQSEYIKEQATPVLEELGKALLTGNYDDYCDSLVNAFSPLYDGVRLGKDGEIPNDVRCRFTWSVDTLKKKTSGFKINDYEFYYDWRLDPMDTSDELKAYIDAVLEVTKAEKVMLVARCLAVNVAAAYITEYGHEGKVDHFVMYSSAMGEGSLLNNALFTGNLALNANTVDQFVSYYLTNEDLIEETELNDFLIALVSMLNYADVLDLGLDTVEKLYAKIAQNVVPRLLLTSYGSFPTYWAMVGASCFDEAKAFVFNGVEEEYAGLIEKIDDYNDNVKAPFKKTLDTLQELTGMKVTVLAKYGTNGLPIFEGSDLESDGDFDVTSASFGATTATINGVLSDEYIAAAIESGNGKYISPDKKIDSSTCWYPEYTWFVKNLHHDVFPHSVHNMIVEMNHHKEQMSVFDNEDYPQYLLYDAGAITPLTEENNTSLGGDWSHDFITVLVRFFRTLFAYLKTLFATAA